MYDEHHTRSTRWQWLVTLGIAAALLVMSPAPGHAWRRTRVFVQPSIVVPFGPYWGPYYWGAYPYSPVIVSPPPPVYVQPAPQISNALPPAPSYWYYCADPQGYYPYVQQCPGGWQPVAPTPQSP